jgi:hypothetical protein
MRAATRNSCSAIWRVERPGPEGCAKNPTIKVVHLEENVRAAEIELSDHEFLQLDVDGKKGAAGRFSR